VPQNPHRRNRSGFSSPQLGQTCIDRIVRALYGVAERRVF
jgi:hypothetical protein